MKKRLFSILLSLAMVITMMPMMTMTAFAADKFTITNGSPKSAKETNHGYITVDETAAEGETVTITVNPAEGYQLKSLTATPVAPTISTVVDVLATIEGGFPFSDVQTEIPDNAWVANVKGGKKCYAYTSKSGSTLAMLLRIPPVGEIKGDYTYLAGTEEVTPGENCYTAPQTLGTVRFDMTDGVLTSFTLTHKESKTDAFDGTYTPASTPSARLKPITPEKQEDGTYQFTMPGYAVTVTAEFEEIPAPAQKTIADILPDDFPTSYETAWITEQGLYICHLDSSNLMFYIDGGGYTAATTAPVTPSGDDYVYTDEDGSVTFNMENGKLTSITVIVNGDDNTYVYALRFGVTVIGSDYVKWYLVDNGTAYNVSGNTLTVGDETDTAGAIEGKEFDCWKIGETVVTDGGTITADTIFTAVYKAAHTHNPVKVAGQAPTKMESGWKDYYKCACGALFEDENGTTPIENLATWKAVGGRGYIAPLAPAVDPTDSDDTDSGADTGDNSNLFLPVTLLILAILGAGAAIGIRRKEER